MTMPGSPRAYSTAPQQVGGSLGLAILSTLAADHTASLIATAPPARQLWQPRPCPVTSSRSLAAAVMLGTGAILMMVLLRRRHLEGIELDPAAVPAAV